MSYKLADGTLSTDYKKGDKFKVLGGQTFEEASIISLEEDDGSICPWFALQRGKSYHGKGTWSINWNNLEKYTEHADKFSEEFCMWLKEKGLYDSFFKQFDLKFYEGSRGISSKEWVVVGFDWEESEEGFDFWSDVGDEWVEYLIKKEGGRCGKVEVYAKEESPTETLGVKYDSGKPKWSLLDFEVLESVVKVLGVGERKYGAKNYRYVEPVRYVDALFRHITSYLSGEELDEESGESHLSHAICCLMFLESARKEGKKVIRYGDE